MAVCENVFCICQHLLFELEEQQSVRELDVSVDIEPFVTSFAFEDLDLSAAMQVAEESRFMKLSVSDCVLYQPSQTETTGCFFIFFGAFG